MADTHQGAAQRFWFILTWQCHTAAADLWAPHVWCKPPVPPQSRDAVLDFRKQSEKISALSSLAQQALGFLEGADDIFCHHNTTSSLNHWHIAGCVHDFMSSTSNSEPTSKCCSRNQDQAMVVQSSSIAMTSMFKPHDVIRFISDLAKLNLYHMACVTYCQWGASLCKPTYDTWSLNSDCSVCICFTPSALC